MLRNPRLEHGDDALRGPVGPQAEGGLGIHAADIGVTTPINALIASSFSGGVNMVGGQVGQFPENGIWSLYGWNEDASK
jgi:hypothetical protein